ncbi:ArsR/SmtB family transcription factor [Streptomyces sp. 184]|uniref:ArsR/SmtB family transcription factor n=1 Tax=Streptomyces sp. 184 TaxID=1827526 RepID=UPI0038912EEF
MARTPAPAPNGDELLKVLAALGNPHRLRIVAALHEGRNYVSRLAREIGMSRPLLHMHLQRLEAAGLITGSLELSEDGKAMKFYEVVSFRYELTPELIGGIARTIGDGDGEPEGAPPGKDQTGTGKPETVKEEAT